MSDLIAGLLVVLGSEEELYRRLRAALERETEALAGLDAEAFAAIVREKEELADEGRLLEEARISVTRELAAQLGHPDARPRLAELCTQLGAEAAPLRDAHNRLVLIAGAVRERLEANANVARDTLSHVRATLRLLGGPVSNEGAYSATSGAPSSTAAPGQLLEQSV